MATDKSEPRVGLILKVAAISIATLVAVRGVLVSYFDQIAQAEEHRKFGEQKPQTLIDVRSDEKARLTTGPMPIDKAMQQIVSRGRKESSPDIMPSASKDLAPLQGWLKMPGEVPPEMMAREAEPAPGAPSMVDAGAAAATLDAAAPKVAKPDRARSDGGAPPKPPTRTP
jgi:hypothetical protein